MSPYTYYMAGSPTMNLDNSRYWIDDFQEVVNDQFYNAPNAYIVYEEEIYESQVYVPVDVRVDRGINSYTGKPRGDDYKYLIYRDLQHSTTIGMKYIMDNSYFIVVNTEIKKNFLASAEIRRCNNVLKWVDTSGSINIEPCILDYQISRAMNNEKPDIIDTHAITTIICQQNSKTRKIKANQKFLFGNIDNWICYRVQGGGVNNYLNNDTFDNDSCRLMELNVERHEYDSGDDLVNGIANYYKYYDINANINNVIITPSGSGFEILEGNSGSFNVSYSGSTGSFVFSLSGTNTVPAVNYTFSTIDGNNFYIKNNLMYSDDNLNIDCVGTSGSRTASIALKGAY